MKTRWTLILFLIAISLGVWIKFFESKKPNTVEAQREAGNVLNFDREKVQGIKIQNGDDHIELRRENGKWRLVAPVRDEADTSVIDNLLSDLENWRKNAVVPGKKGAAGKASLAEYGLAQPKLRLVLQMPDGPPEIRFGKEAAFEGTVYVRVGDSPDMLIAAVNVRDDVAKKTDDFRDRKLTSLTTAQTTRAILKSAAGELELAKKNEHWEIVKPLQARGDDQKIGDLLAQVTNARIEEFLGGERADPHTYGLAEPRGSIKIYGADDTKGEILQIGSAAKKKGQIYARLLPRGGIYALPEKIGDILTTQPNDLRDSHLLRLDQNNLDRVHIIAAGQPEIVLARKGETWTIASRNNQPANSPEVRRLINTLNDQVVTRFVADTASDLAKYGLDRPQLQLTFSSFASENTAETTAGEHPFLTLSLGKIEGNEVYARVGEEPFIVAVDRKLLDEIWSDPLRWQELSVFKFKPNDIQRLSRVTDREESFERSAPNVWNDLKENAPVNQTNIQSLLNTLGSLRAVRWAGATTAEQGFEQAPLVLTFAVAPDLKALHKLTIGKHTADAMWFAKIEGMDGTFVISNPDFSALRLTLTKAAPASPSPSASASISPVTNPPAAASTPTR